MLVFTFSHFSSHILLGTLQPYAPPPAPDPNSKSQSTAEQDMELIRTKRATTTANANGPPGQPKSKYRKRSVGRSQFGSRVYVSPDKYHIHSVLRLLASVTLVIFERLPNGDGARMARGHSATRVVCVRKYLRLSKTTLTCPAGIQIMQSSCGNETRTTAKHRTLTWKRFAPLPGLQRTLKRRRAPSRPRGRSSQSPARPLTSSNRRLRHRSSTIKDRSSL